MKRELLIYKIMNLCAFLSMVMVNILAQLLPLNGRTTAEVSAMYPTLLTPSGFAFSIWSVIYLLIGIFVIRQFFSRDGEGTEKAGLLFALSCGFNVGWILFFHFEMMELALFSILLLWMSLYILNRDMEKAEALTRAGFNIYFHWITVAGVIQLFVFLSVHFPVLHLERTATLFTVGALILLTIYGAGRTVKKNELLTGLTLFWAILGIFISHVGAGYNLLYSKIIGVSGLCLVVLLGAVIWAAIKKYVSCKNKKISL